MKTVNINYWKLWLFDHLTLISAYITSGIFSSFLQKYCIYLMKQIVVLLLSNLNLAHLMITRMLINLI